MQNEVVVQDMITNALKEFNLEDAAIMVLSERYMPLKTNGLKDAKAYDAVHVARMDIKGRRVDVQKRGKKLREDALLFQRGIVAEEKRLIGLLQPIEDHLQAEEDKVDNEKARIKKEAEEKEAARVQGRVNVLFDYGCKFNGLDYFRGSLSMSASRVKDASDEDFQKFCLMLQTMIDSENRQKAEEEKKRKEEAERLAKVAAEQEAEEEKKRKEEAERLAKVAAEQEAERQRLAAIAKAQAEQEAKIKAEQEAIERQKREIQAQKDREEAEKKRKAELEAAEKAAAEKARIAEAERIKRESEEKAEKDRLAKIEAERQEALRPDKEKLLAYADAIETVKCPEVSKESQAIIAEAKTNLTKVANIIRKKTRDL